MDSYLNVNGKEEKSIIPKYLKAYSYAGSYDS